jgi:hypothetical protein
MERNNKYLVGFEVLTVVVMKSSIFWDIMLCSWLKVNRHFRGTYRLHLQGQRISWVRNQHLLSCWFLARLIIRLWRWRRCFSETSVKFQQTTRCYNPEDSTLQQIPCWKWEKLSMLHSLFIILPYFIQICIRKNKSTFKSVFKTKPLSPYVGGKPWNTGHCSNILCL